MSPGNAFRKAAPRPNIRAKVSKPQRPSAKSGAPGASVCPGCKPAPRTKGLGNVRVTSKAKQSRGAAKPRQGVIPGSTPGKAGSAPGASPGW